ncbi:4271_t:CDS:2 [Funneliformis mosseae]|uniref:4271_t:CDS:1 n=1 Tax=Funneliformis mosseae TaxID=27381 RepID=A0A9N9GNS7_FUNMO|nr:4271_t:CDS:2 [Funneliformis mosseae]
MDVLSELDKLLAYTYTTDVQFMMDVMNLLNQLKDPHTKFIPNCYFEQFLFEQGLSLYSVVKSDDKQVIKIFNDSIIPSLTDCEVTHIDSQPALSFITSFANSQIGESKDLNVRFNLALASLTLEGGFIQLSSDSEQFTKRDVLPEKESVEYNVICYGERYNFTREWMVRIKEQEFLEAFTDSKSYWNSFCANNNNLKVNTLPKNVKIKKENSLIFNQFESLMLRDEQVKLVKSGKIAQFYIITSVESGAFGVVVISTVDTEKNENELVIDELLEGFRILINAGVKKLVLDFINNGGGTILIAHFITRLLSPPLSSKLPIAFPTDMKITPLSELLITQSVIKNDTSTPFNPKLWISTQTSLPFNSANIIEHFIGNNSFARNNLGGQQRYSNKFLDNTKDLLEFFLAKKNFEIPWNVSNDIIILTNGNCGSSCANIVQYFNEIYHVKSVAVGGLFEDAMKTGMSFASFPGGQSYSDKALFKGFEKLGLLTNDSNIKTVKYLIGGNEAQLKEFEVNALLKYALREVYSLVNEDEVLEYSYRPANYRIFYDELSARNPAKLWIQAVRYIID